jgi:Cof subfamily protein (haloacid dehalogenase superfamily)
MDYKIISFDLDGTLFGPDMEISRENSRALAELVSRGVTVIANTGRTYWELPESARNESAFRYYSYSNGAVLYDKKTDTVLRSACMPNTLTSPIFDLLRTYRVSICVHAHGNGHFDINGHNEENYISHRVPEGFRIMYFSCIKAIPEFERFLYETDAFESIVVFFADDEEKAECTAKLREFEDIFVVSTAKDNIEIVSKRAGKGHALHELCDRLGVDYAATIAVGDSINDIDHIRSAGLSLAMENAVPALKEIADAVICHHTEPVAQYVLDHYIAK